MKRKFRILRIWYYGKYNFSKKIYIRIRNEKYIKNRERFLKMMCNIDLKYCEPDLVKLLELLTK